MLLTKEDQLPNHQLTVNTTRTGKIARLPHAIREQLNRRLQDGQQAAPILKWLNALPRVRAILAAEFDRRSRSSLSPLPKGREPERGVRSSPRWPISPQNLSEWKNGGYRDWQVRQDVLALAKNLEDKHGFGQKALKRPFTDQLAHWLTLRYAAAAHSLATNNPNPKTQWNRLRELCADVTRLRGGDLHAERLRLERDWLAFEKSVADQRTEKKFWAWTKRPDIHNKLVPIAKRGMSPELRRQVEDELCLMDDPGPDIARLMRARREAKEKAQAEKQAAQTDQIKPNQTQSNL